MWLGQHGLERETILRQRGSCVAPEAVWGSFYTRKNLNFCLLVCYRPLGQLSCACVFWLITHIFDLGALPKLRNESFQAQTDFKDRNTMAEEGMSEADALRLQSLLSAEDEDDELDYSAPAPAPGPAPAAPVARTRAPPARRPESATRRRRARAGDRAGGQVEADEALARAIQASLADAPPAPAEESAAAGEAEWARQLAALEQKKEAPPPPTKPATPPPPPPANTTCFVAVVGFDHARGNVLEWAFPGAEAAWSESLPFAALPDGAHHVAAGKGEVCRFAVVREDKSRLYGCSCVMQAAPDELTGRAKAQATRSRVQKAVCVLHTSRDVAWSARLGSRIEACAAALFAGGDLDDRGLLRDFHSSVREMKAGEPATHLFDACARLGFAGALRCVKALALGHALTFVHAKSVCAAPDAALAFADVLYAFDEDNESVDSVAVFGRELSTQMRIEPAVALMDLDRVVSEGDEFQVIAGTANAHLAEAGLGPRLAPCVVARLEADAPKASRVRAFGPSQYASSCCL